MARRGGAGDRDLHARPGGRRVDAASCSRRPAPAPPHVFVCGPTAFVESAAAHLLRAGHDTERVRTERFGGEA